MSRKEALRVVRYLRTISHGCKLWQVVFFEGAVTIRCINKDTEEIFHWFGSLNKERFDSMKYVARYQEV